MGKSSHDIMETNDAALSRVHQAIKESSSPPLKGRITCFLSDAETVFSAAEGESNPKCDGRGMKTIDDQELKTVNWNMCKAILLCAAILWSGTQTGYSFALAARGTIDLKGNDLATDSYDSSAPDYPGYWTNAIRKAGGDVISIEIITNSVLNLGNANIAGRVVTGPSGNLAYNANVSVGDLAWADVGTPGIKPGWFKTNVSIPFPDAAIPDVPWMNPGGYGLGGPGTAPDGKSYVHVFMSAASGGYFTLLDSGDVYVSTNVTVTVRADASMGTFAPNNLYVAGVGAEAGRFLAYVDCTNCALGTTDRAQNGLPGNLSFMGTSNCTSFAYKGNGSFAGVIYAPSANFQGAGGGSGIIDFYGYVVAKTVQVNGHYHFHFDESLSLCRRPLVLSGIDAHVRAALVGQNTIFDIYALGSEPLDYQWQLNGNAIPDATNSFLPLTNIQMTDAGLYAIVITNSFGSTTNSVQLAVYEAPTPVLQPPTFSSDGSLQVPVGGVPDFNYAIEVSTNLMNWTPLTTNTAPYTFTDTNTATLLQRFFRAVYSP
jgi:hypothetical protein